MTTFASLTDLATRSARPDWTLAAIASLHCSWYRCVARLETHRTCFCNRDHFVVTATAAVVANVDAERLDVQSTLVAR